MSDERNADIEVIKTLIGVQADTAKRIEDNLKEWRQENRDQIAALRLETEKELDHQKRNNAQMIQTLETKTGKAIESLEGKITKALDENQAESDTRWEKLETMFAGKWVELTVKGVCVSFGLAIVGVIVKLVIPH